jgi:DnaD/phage-associated family protein
MVINNFKKIATNLRKNVYVLCRENSQGELIMISIIEKDENVMVFQPKLAQLLGLNEAIIINQIHYWVKRSKNIIEGRYWVYNTYESWQKQICFLSESTIKKTIKKLEGIGIIKSGNFNKSKLDKTKWYTIDYEVLQTFYEKAEETSGGKISLRSDTDNQRTDKNEPSNGLELPVEEVSSNQAIPETTTEITTKDNKKDNKEHRSDKNLTGGFRAVVDFYSENVRLPGSYELEKIKYLYEEFKNPDLIIFAMKQSVESNVRNLRYVEKVLYSWLDKGIKTKNTAEAFVENYKKYKGDVENGRFVGIHGENKFYNSKASSKDSSKWSGYR